MKDLLLALAGVAIGLVDRLVNRPKPPAPSEHAAREAAERWKREKLN
jgi:hypothetical protein